MQRLGFAIVIYPGAMVRVQTFAALRYLETLQRDGATDSLRGSMLNFKQLNELLGTDQWLAHGRAYDQN